MAKELFVDTGAWVALADLDDRHHSRAAAAFPSLLKEHRLLVTTNLVVAETYILLRLTLGHGPAIAFLDHLETSQRVERVYATPDLDGDAEETLRRYGDQRFSFTDAVSFALMRRRGIARAFAFDAHFSTAGFVCVPSTA